MRRRGHQAQHAATGGSRAAAQRTKSRRGDKDVQTSVLSTVASTLTFVASLAVLAAIAGSVLGMYRLDIVLSGSMKPAYQPGDIVYAVATPAEKIGAGDVILFKTPKEYGSSTVTHRVVSAQMSPSGVVSIRTKGDNNDDVDPWTAEVTTDDVWIVKKSIPKVGYVASWAKDWWPLLIAFAISMPLLGVARNQVRETWRRPPAAGGADFEDAAAPADQPGDQPGDVTCEGDDATTGQPGRSTAGAKVASLLWFAPALVVIATGVWVSYDGAGVVSKVTQDAKSWQSDQIADEPLLVERFTAKVEYVNLADGPILASRTTEPDYASTGGNLQRALTLPAGAIKADKQVTMRAAAKETNELATSLHVKVSSCDRPWKVTDGGFTCAGTSSVLVGDAPIHDTTISVLDPGDYTPAKATHLLLELRLPPDAASSVAGQSAELDVRFDAN